MKRIILSTSIIAIIIAAVAGIWGYRLVMLDNIIDSKDGKHVLYVSTDWDYDSLKNHLYPILKNSLAFDQLATQMNLPNKVIPGMYFIGNNMGNRALIQKLRSGKYEQVKVLLKGSTTRLEILGILGQNLQPDSMAFKSYIDTSTFLKSAGYTKEDWPCIMTANTYYFNWATTAAKVFKRFEEEKRQFWNESRMQKLAKIGLTENQAIILASIVDAETMRDAELRTIAGVYLNRLQKGWPLQADPTVKYIALAAGRKRVLYVDLKMDNPYNTYIYKGLPPGPVILPSVKTIDAVLNAESHNYMFFCAKEDMSGYHVFTNSLAEHNSNAARYHRALDARNIRE